MIFSAILGFFALVLNGFVNLMPTGNPLPSEMINAFTFIFTEAFKWNSIVPLDTFIQVSIIGISVELAILLWHGLRWLFRIIRPGT